MSAAVPVAVVTAPPSMLKVVSSAPAGVSPATTTCCWASVVATRMRPPGCSASAAPGDAGVENSSGTPSTLLTTARPPAPKVASGRPSAS
jgi:hypothetical protein